MYTRYVRLNYKKGTIRVMGKQEQFDISFFFSTSYNN